MLLSPVDYQAFAEATGSEYPDTAAEKAKLAPIVADWKAAVAAEQRESRDNGALTATAGLLGAVGLGALGLTAYNHYRKQGLSEETAAQLAKNDETTANSAGSGGSGPAAPPNFRRADVSVPDPYTRNNVRVTSGPNPVAVVDTSKGTYQQGVIFPADARNRGTMLARNSGEYAVSSLWNDDTFGPLLRAANTPELRDQLYQWTRVNNPAKANQVLEALSDGGKGFNAGELQWLNREEDGSLPPVDRYGVGSAFMVANEEGGATPWVVAEDRSGRKQWVQGDAQGARYRLAPTDYDAYGTRVAGERDANGEAVTIISDRAEPGMRKPGYNPENHLFISGNGLNLSEEALERKYSISPANESGETFVVNSDGIPVVHAQWGNWMADQPLRASQLIDPEEIMSDDEVLDILYRVKRKNERKTQNLRDSAAAEGLDPTKVSAVYDPSIDSQIQRIENRQRDLRYDRIASDPQVGPDPDGNLGAEPVPATRHRRGKAYDAPPYRGVVTSELPAGDIDTEYTGKRQYAQATSVDAARALKRLNDRGYGWREAGEIVSRTYNIPEPELVNAVLNLRSGGAPAPERSGPLPAAHAVGGHSSRDWLTQALSALQVAPKEDRYTIDDLVTSGDPKNIARAAKSFLSSMPELVEVSERNGGPSTSTTERISLVSEGLIDAAADYAPAMEWAKQNDPDLYSTITRGGKGAPTFEQFARPYIRRHLIGANLERSNAGAGQAPSFQVAADVGDYLAAEAAERKLPLEAVINEAIGSAGSPIEAIWNFDERINAVANQDDPYGVGDRLARGFMNAATPGDGTRFGQLKQRLGATAQSSYRSQDPIRGANARMPIAIKFGLADGAEIGEYDFIDSAGKHSLVPIVDPATNRVTSFKRAPGATDQQLRQQFLQIVADPTIEKLSGSQLEEWINRDDNRAWAETILDRQASANASDRSKGKAKGNTIIGNIVAGADSARFQASDDFRAGLITREERNTRWQAADAAKARARNLQGVIDSNRFSIQSQLAGANLAAPAGEGRRFTEGTGYVVDYNDDGPGVRLAPDTRAPKVSYEAFTADNQPSEMVGAKALTGAETAALRLNAALDDHLSTYGKKVPNPVVQDWASSLASQYNIEPTDVLAAAAGRRGASAGGGVSTWSAGDASPRFSAEEATPAPAAPATERVFDLRDSLWRPGSEPALGVTASQPGPDGRVQRAVVWEPQIADDGDVEQGLRSLQRAGYGETYNPVRSGERLTTPRVEMAVARANLDRLSGQSAPPPPVRDAASDERAAMASFVGDYMDKLVSRGIRTSKDNSGLEFTRQANPSTRMPEFTSPGPGAIAGRVRFLRNKGVI